jgi:hypothetical protein
MQTVAVIVHPSTFLINVLVCETADAAHDPGLSRLHACLLSFLREACATRPLVVTDSGRVFLLSAIQRMQQTQGQTPAARTLVKQLMPNAAWVRA